MPKRATRKLSAYNLFVKKMIPTLMEEAKKQGKPLKASEAMKLAAFTGNTKLTILKINS